MENNETWRERFDAKIGYCTRSECVDLDEIKDFFAAELLTLADKIGAYKKELQMPEEGEDAAHAIAVAHTVLVHNQALDAAISLIKEMVK